MTENDALIKPVKAVMLPNLRLMITFDNGEVRYLSDVSILELFIQPVAYTWIGNEISILDNGDIKLNDLIIPYDYLIKNSRKHIQSIPE